MFKTLTCKALRSKELIKDEKRNLFLACRKYTKIINPIIVTNKHNRSMIQSNCTICGSKRTSSYALIKEHQAMGLLSNLGIRTPLSQVPLLNVLF